MDTNLKDALKNAMESFSNNQGCLPQHFILYRDGVGDAMRQQVLNREVTQLREAIKETYNKAATKPFFTVIFVNKRISQRFFVKRNGVIENPPPGTLIDGTVVSSDDGNREFDFYLLPQKVTQGSALATHYYVAYNDSPLNAS